MSGKVKYFALGLMVTLAGTLILTQTTNILQSTQKNRENSEPPKNNDLKQSLQRGNKTVTSFSLAKKKLKPIYQGLEETFYCGCSFQNKRVNLKSCAYTPMEESPRAFRIEWEHVVPASFFGRSFKAWRSGHPNCISKNGKKYKGRRCARKVSDKFNLMEADLYNLVPAIGEVNQMRGNSLVKILENSESQLTNCQTKISDSGIEPRDKVKGFTARIYLYMNHSYPGHGIISKKNKKIFTAWNQKYPPDKNELTRAQRIKNAQGNENVFVSQWEG